MELLLLFFFCPETTYRRSAALNIDLGTERVTPADSKSIDDAPESTDDAPWTFWEKLRPFQGILSDDNLLKIIVRPLPLLLFPAVLYALIIGLSHSWFSVMLGISALIYGSAPYNLTIIQLGFLGFGGFIASVLGFMSGPLNDWFCKYLARKNGGVYEPEVNLIPGQWKLNYIVPSRYISRYLCIWFHWIFWIWNCIALSAFMDHCLPFRMYLDLRLVLPEHCDVRVCHGLFEGSCP